MSLLTARQVTSGFVSATSFCVGEKDAVKSSLFELREILSDVDEEVTVRLRRDDGDRTGSCCCDIIPLRKLCRVRTGGKSRFHLLSGDLAHRRDGRFSGGYISPTFRLVYFALRQAAADAPCCD